jgi:transposase
MVHLNRQIKETDDTIACTVCSDERVRRLCTVPGVGLVTATTFVATLDQAGRFTRAHQVEAYLGLVPRERSSGETQRRGRITKSGNVRARCLLVEAAWCIMRYKKHETAGLRAWTERIALRRGKSRAAVALARRLAGILYALMRDGTVYHPGAVPRADDRSSVAA